MSRAAQQDDGRRGCALSTADLERARQIAADAPPLTPEARDRLRAILAGCAPAAAPREAAVPPEPRKGGDDVAA